MRMMFDRTETLEDRIGMAPDLELGVNNLREFIERGEESVVEPQTAQEFPDSFNRIELRTVWWEKLQDEIGFLLVPPGGVEIGMMIPGVVDNENHTAATASADPAKLAEEIPTGLSIKGTFRLGGAKLAISNPDRPKIANRFSGGPD